jgi:cyclopropane-fatty-acyl-phospholipid synthase
MKIEIEHEGSCLGATGGTGRLIVRDALADLCLPPQECLRLQCHSADRTVAGNVPPNLRMHRTGVNCAPSNRYARHICRKLQLQPTDQLLDIGCGCGALIIHAAKHYGVRARGITLSLEQLKCGRERIAKAGLENRVTIDLQDYRELEGESVYEKISSVGMVEHVGLKNLPRYFSTVQRLLKPGGLYLNHGITSDSGGCEKTMSTEFINRYVFPDGQLDTISGIQRHMEQARFEIADVESLRAHYALTLRHWVKRLEQHHSEALRFVNEFTYRVWRLYMSAAAIDFESGQIGIYQVLATKRAATPAATRLTRRHLYSDEATVSSS